MFYYSWYGSAALDGAYLHWTQNGRRAPAQIASSFFPARGVYSSGDPYIVGSQMREIRRYGIDTVAVSWWGWGSLEDRRLPGVVRAARKARLRVAVHIEPYPGRTAESVSADIDRLRRLGASDFYVYRPRDIAAADWAAVDARPAGVRLFAGTGLAGFASAGRFDGIYTYDIMRYPASSFRRICAQARKKHLLCAPSVGPGFDA